MRIRRSCREIIMEMLKYLDQAAHRGMLKVSLRYKLKMDTSKFTRSLEDARKANLVMVNNGGGVFITERGRYLYVKYAEFERLARIYHI